MQDAIGKLRQRLVNWGIWCNWEIDTGPAQARCVSLESRHIPEAGDVWDQPEPSTPTPNVADAEELHKHIRKLSQLQQYALATEYGGTPCVMRFRRVGEHVHKRSLETAEVMLYESMVGR